MRRRQRRVVVRFSDNGPLTFSRKLDVVADAANVARTRFVGPRISEVRGKSETSEHNPIFGNKTAGRGRVRPRLVGRSRFLPRTSGFCLGGRAFPLISSAG